MLISFQVDKFETEKSALTKDVADLTTRLVEARLSINDLEEQNVSIFYISEYKFNFLNYKLSVIF